MIGADGAAMDEPMIRLRAAFDRVKELPDFNPNERAHWPELRVAVEKVLERTA